MRSQAVALLLLLLLSFATGSAWSQFTTVINLPGDSVPTSIGAGTQLNILEGGRLPFSSVEFTALGGEVNLLGGRIERHFAAKGDSVVNISSGQVNLRLTATEQSEVNISGGTFASSYAVEVADASHLNISGGNFNRHFNAAGVSTTNITGGLFQNDLKLEGHATAILSGGVFRQNVATYADATLLIRGGEFRVDGIAVAGLNIPGVSAEVSLTPGQLISGTLADGTPFGFVQTPSSTLAPGRIRLESTSLPVVPAELHVPGDSVSRGLREGQTLWLNDQGLVLPYFIAGWGSRIVMEGGTFGQNSKLIHTDMLVTGGEVGPQFRATEGSQVTVVDGKFRDIYFSRGATADVRGGIFEGASFTSGAEAMISGGEFAYVAVSDSAHLTLSAGTLKGGLDLSANGHATVQGGTVRRGVEVRSGSLTVAGGTFGDAWRTRTDTQLRLVGGEFHLDGDPIAGLEIIGDILPFNIPSGTTLTGILADGTPFHISSEDSDSIAAGTLTLELAPVPSAAPLHQILFAPSDRTTLRAGQRVVLSPGGSFGDYFRTGDGAQIEIDGGALGHHFEGNGTTVELNAGTIGEYFNGFVRTQVTVKGGSIGNYAMLSGESRLEMTGGILGNGFRLSRGSHGTISGGTIGDGFVVSSGGTLEVTGGRFGKSFHIGSQPIRGTEGEPHAAALQLSPFAMATVRGGEFQDVFIHREGVANIYGGAINNGLYVYGGVANIHDGTISSPMTLNMGGVVNVWGGNLPDNVRVIQGVINLYDGNIGMRMSLSSPFFNPNTLELNVYGGSVGSHWVLERHSTANIHGGTLGSDGTLLGATMNVFGGTLGSLDVHAESSLTLHATHFALDGPPGDGPEIDLMSLLEPGVPYLLEARNTTLIATLADGSPFDLELLTTSMIGRDHVHANASLYLVLVPVPEPRTITLVLVSLATVVLVNSRTRRFAQP